MPAQGSGGGGLSIDTMMLMAERDLAGVDLKQLHTAVRQAKAHLRADKATLVEEACTRALRLLPPDRQLHTCSR